MRKRTLEDDRRIIELILAGYSQNGIKMRECISREKILEIAERFSLLDKLKENAKRNHKRAIRCYAFKTKED